jgi:hypothetical protein
MKSTLLLTDSDRHAMVHRVGIIVLTCLPVLQYGKTKQVLLS